MRKSFHLCPDMGVGYVSICQLDPSFGSKICTLFSVYIPLLMVKHGSEAEIHSHIQYEFASKQHPVGISLKTFVIQNSFLTREPAYIGQGNKQCLYAFASMLYHSLFA